MISITELNKIIELHFYNEYQTALIEKSQKFEKIIDNTLTVKANKGRKYAVIQFNLDTIENLYATVNCLCHYHNNGFQVECEKINYYSYNQNSKIDLISENDFSNKIKFILLDMANEIFNKRDLALQNKLFKENNLYLDLMNVCLKGARIKNIIIRFSY